MMGFGYAIVCPLAYLMAGSLKFLVNSLRLGKPAFHKIGLGAFPSTHTAIVSSAACLVALRGGIDTPAFAVSLAVLLVVVIDAMDLRNKVGKIHRVLKELNPESHAVLGLRERVGHTPVEVIGGLVVGFAAASLVKMVS